MLVVVVGLIGMTVAYFSNSTSIENEFETAEYGTDVVETFTSPTDWQPGDETPKVLTVKNTGEVDEAVRIKIEESWKSKNNTTLPLTQGNNVAAIINWINTDDWTKVDVDGEDYYYYYYNYKLAPDEETSELLDKVTFNPLIGASTTCTDSIGTNGETIRNCTSNGSGYDGATYTLKFTIETVQYNKYADAWGTNVSIAPTKEIVVFGLHVNPKSETYETGDKHQMFAFKHARTTQTPSQTDYRYIGNDPYNYVKFNCDASGNNCEIWRIVGVFDVERRNPLDNSEIITEKRMKLVRGSKLENTMYWNNSSNNNNWTDENTSLRVYLNSDFYNGTASEGLKDSARAMIDEANFYLGGISYDHDGAPYGSTEELYEAERGDATYSNAAINWFGHVGLLYPSDQFMTYANGIDRTCFDDPFQCDNTRSNKSWLYNIGYYEGNNGKSYTWFISPLSLSSNDAIVTTNNGNLEYNYVNYGSRGILPVVYLSSTVKIVSGEGTSSNPYVLSNNN